MSHQIRLQWTSPGRMTWHVIAVCYMVVGKSSLPLVPILNLLFWDPCHVFPAYEPAMWSFLMSKMYHGTSLQVYKFIEILQQGIEISIIHRVLRAWENFVSKSRGSVVWLLLWSLDLLWWKMTDSTILGLPAYFPEDWRLVKFEGLLRLKIWRPSFSRFEELKTSLFCHLWP